MSDADATKELCKRFMTVCEAFGLYPGGPVGEGDLLELFYKTDNDSQRYQLHHEAGLRSHGVRLASKLAEARSADRTTVLELVNLLNIAGFDGAFSLDEEDSITYRLSLFM